jgi:APA family basic amino acid/polyamine antiporter
VASKAGPLQVQPETLDARAGADRASRRAPELVRGLGTFDAFLITVGSILGTGIYLTTSDIAKALPHAGLILMVWLLGGVLTLSGALTYAELGALFPRAGGQYQYLKEAYGPLAGFLFGWASFLVFTSGGIAALAVGFGKYLGVFLPYFSTDHVLLAVPLGRTSLQVSGGQVAGVLAIAFLTGVNYCGLRSGARVQNAVSLTNIAALLALVLTGLLLKPHASTALFSPLPGGIVSSLTVGMIAVLWTYDGWYTLTFTAGEMRDPGRTLPRGLIYGTIAITALYCLVNLVYLRALSIPDIAASPRVGEAAAQVLFGPSGGRLVSAAVLVSTFGCLSATILTCSRIFLPMARDGLFFRSLAEIHPRFQVPGASLLAQGAWASVLTLSGTYSQLYTYVVFVGLLLHAATGVALFVFRRRLPEEHRPYRAWGYPVVPALFVLTTLALAWSTLRESPVEARGGLVLLALGLPAYWAWRRKGASRTGME